MGDRLTDPRVDQYRQDTHVRALWDLARSEIMRRRGDFRPVAMDDAEVVWLRELLIGAWEGGQARTLAQAAALDGAIVARLKHGPAGFIVPAERDPGVPAGFPSTGDADG